MIIRNLVLYLVGRKHFKKFKVTYYSYTSLFFFNLVKSKFIIWKKTSNLS